MTGELRLRSEIIMMIDETSDSEDMVGDCKLFFMFLYFIRSACMLNHRVSDFDL